MLQADFSMPGHLAVTLYILKVAAKAPKKRHDELRRHRKIWLIPSFTKEMDASGKIETITGIDIVFDIKKQYSVDPEHAFLTIDIPTKSVPSQEELDRLFTKKPFFKK